MTYNLDDPLDRKRLVIQIDKDIDKFCISEFSEDPRKHLGASVIGDDCHAKAWSTFRWLKQEQVNGQMYRLFNRGHEEEARFVRWLRGIGFEVLEFDPTTGKQFRIKGGKGHFGGSLDSLMKAPARYMLSASLIWLGEFKTHNEKSFTELAGKRSGQHRLGGKGVQKCKPMHFAQMSAYGRAYGLKYALYCAVNKNTDELYHEIVVLDPLKADDLFRKAEGVINSQTRPMKIANTPSYFDCKYCEFSGICHANEVPTKNCRSCINACAVENGEWFCNLYSQHNGNIPDETISVGCDSWQRIV